MITRAGTGDAQVLIDIGAETFIDSHKDSAPAHEIDRYVKEKYNMAAITKDLADPSNIYHIIQHEDNIAGFSKMMLNSKQPDITLPAISKMDQIYLLKSFHGQKLGAQLLQHNIQYSKSGGQQGMWLIVWINNHKAITVYEKFGFTVAAHGNFHLTANHSNPCHIMLLNYDNH